MSYISYVAGVQSGALAYVNPMKDKAFGVGAYYINSGEMKRTDDLNTDLGTFSVSYLDINPAFGWQPMKKLSVGAGLKMLYGKIDSFWTLGLAADVGVKYTLSPGLQATFVAHNLGSSLKAFETQTDKLPIDFGLGFGYEPVSRLRLDLEAHQPLDNKFEVRAGAEGWVSPERLPAGRRNDRGRRPEGRRRFGYPGRAFRRAGLQVEALRTRLRLCPDGPARQHAPDFVPLFLSVS